MIESLALPLNSALSDPVLLRVFALILLGGLVACLALWRRAAGRVARLDRDLVLMRAGRDHDMAELKREAGLRAEAEAALAAAEKGREAAALAASRAEAAAEALQAQNDALRMAGERSATALEAARREQAELAESLATTRLAAEKDREAALREVEVLKTLRKDMREQFSLLSSETLRIQGEGMEKRQSEQLSALLTPFREQVHRFQTELQTRNQKTDEERARLREQIDLLHKRSEDISREAVALTQALKGDSRQQGAWGEMILSRILEESGLEDGIHYELQASYTDGDGRRWRPDCVIRMPQERVLVIDSKVSLVAYEEAANATDADIRAGALARHVASLRAHIRDLAEKGYQRLESGAVDYVLLFIPIEGAFSEALRADPALARHAIDARIGLTTPTMLMPMLRTVDHIWTVERRERNAAEIASRAGALYDKVAGFVESLETVGKAIERAHEAHGQAMSRLTRGRGNVLRQVEMLRELGADASKRIALESDEGDEEAQPALPANGRQDPARVTNED